MASLLRVTIYAASTVALAYGLHKTTGLTVDDVKAVPGQMKASAVAAKEAVDALGGAGSAVGPGPKRAAAPDRVTGKGRGAKVVNVQHGGGAADVLSTPADPAPSFHIPAPPSPPARKAPAKQPRPTRVP